MKSSLAVTLFTLLLVTDASAINKCTGPDGKIAFQDAPCTGRGEAIEVRPASGRAPHRDTPNHQEGEKAGERLKPVSEAERIERLVAASQRERRKKDLESRLVPNAAAAIVRQREACDAELSALKAKKSRANNNLAGATWEASISSEMTAVATRCESKANELRDHLKTVRGECRDLGACTDR